jgi:D-3-phosphoglycerate dehydrogenase
MARILVTEQLARSGLDKLAAAGHEVDVRLDWTPESLPDLLPGAAALVVRSATKVTRELLEAGRELRVVGRAGVGLDNVDVAAATDRGIMVVNAPESNVISAAEHTFALLLAQARNVPQAHAALVAGSWERARWEGVELYGKTLGVVGLGRVGALVATRAQAFGMRIVAHDPYAAPERARQLGVELLPLADLVETADFITIHLPKNAETTGLFSKELLARTKRGVRLVNAARGGIVDEEALAEAIRSGQVAGAALDVFSVEPATRSPLFGLPGVVVTPHLGASTEEAQDKAGEQIAEQVVLALRGDFVPYAVNVSARGASEAVRPFLGLAEELGRLAWWISGGLSDEVEVAYEGALAGEDVGILTISVLKGLLAPGSEEPVTFVNAPRLAEERGLRVRESQTATPHDRVSLVTVRTPAHAVAGTLAGHEAKPRIVMVDEHPVELPPAPHMLVVRNDDRPGMIGVVGTVVGAAGVSITDMAVGQTAGTATALMVLSLDRPLSPEVVASLATTPGILDVHQVGGA